MSTETKEMASFVRGATAALLVLSADRFLRSAGVRADTEKRGSVRLRLRQKLRESAELRKNFANMLDPAAALEAGRNTVLLKRQAADLTNASGWMITELVEWAIEGDAPIIQLMAEAPDVFEPEFRQLVENEIDEAAVRLRGEAIASEKLSAVAGQNMAGVSRPQVAPDVDIQDGFRRRNTEGDSATAFTVWFATNRTPVTREGQIVNFSGSRSEGTHLGRCDVTIPKCHQIGSIGSPWWKRLLSGDDRLKLRELYSLEERVFWADIRGRTLSEVHPGDPVLFIHGYNTSFEEAAVRAAQIGADLNILGPMVFFSWPSKGKTLGYLADEASIQASEKEITEFILRLADESRPRRVHIIAHSMGNRAVVATIDKIVEDVRNTGNMLGQIILAAPDVDVKVFRDQSSHFPLCSERTTLYVSQKDLLVNISRILHDEERLGFAPPVTICAGVDTVDVTGIDLSLFGHGYVAEARAVVSDIYDLISNDRSPDKRFGFRKMQSKAEGPYWSIKAGGY